MLNIQVLYITYYHTTIMAEFINRPASQLPSRTSSGYSPLILCLVLLLLAALAYIGYEKYIKQPMNVAPTEDTTDRLNDVIKVNPDLNGHDTSLADLGSRPDWSLLDVWQDTITRDDFLQLLTEVYTIDDTWKRYIEINTDHAIIRTDTRVDDATYRLNFADTLSEISPQRNWSSAGDLIPGTREKPLAGLHIAIDPGHIGGDFAKIEERWFQIGDNKPLMEGNMTLATAKIIKQELTKLGARVYLFRGINQPVNSKRPDDYLKEATAKAKSLGQMDDISVKRIQNRFFYRTGEIRARARRVNLAFKPDLVLCLHYNAEAWSDPSNPTLIDKNHYHVLLHGALTSSEIGHDDERFEMLVKILQRTHDEEKNLGMYFAQALRMTTKLPHYDYSPISARAKKIEGPANGVWARNLLANRIYQCPVIFLEPYVMNNKEVHERFQLGDYSGVKPINGVDKKSIYREYADAVLLALKEYYLAHRVIYEPEK